MDDSEKKKQVRFREPPSVPFLWELRPGTPKNDWKPEPPPPPPPSSSYSSSAAASVSQVPTPPIKLIASIPFAWEEKPGTPIPHFSLDAEAKIIDMESSSSSSSSPSSSYFSSSSSATAAAASVSQVPKSPVKLIASIPFAWEEKPGTPIPHFSLHAEAKLIDMESSSSSSSSPSSSYSSSSSSATAAAASVSQVPKSPVKLIASIPFAWEEKPGAPIPHFSLNSEAKLIDMEFSPASSSSSSYSPPPPPSAAAASVSQVPKSPIKLIASIPFAWEEKPGTPIPHFSLNSEAKFIDLASPSFSPSSSAYHVACKERSCDGNSDEGSDIDDSVISMEPESFGCSDPSLMANCVIASEKLSAGIPLRKSSLSEQHSEQIVESSCSSPASENGSSTSSYETRRSSLVGASFLESLFPLFPSNTGFLESAGSSSTPLELKERRDFDGEEDNGSAMLRKPPTLGELIMMSRRRSYRKKAVQMSNWDLQRSITRKEAFGCFMFASSCKMIEGLFNKKFLPRLKLV